MSASWRIAALVTVLIFGLIRVAPVRAGVAYQDPVGGWRYKLQGDMAIFNDGRTGEIDGTWHSDQADRWDGSGISDGIGPPYPFDGTPNVPEGPAPGGVEAFVDGQTTYLRLQDPGNPEPHGYWQDPEDSDDDSNRRLNFGHRMVNDGALPSRLVLSDGITISFRARIPNSGPLDNIYTQDAGGANVVLPWFGSPPADYNGNSVVDAADYVVWRKHLDSAFQLANEVEGVTPGMVTTEDYNEWKARFGDSQNLGRGYPIHDEGRGMFYIVQQNDVLGVDSAIAFSLMTSVDAENYCSVGANAELCANPRGGLVMNNLNGNSAVPDVDTFDGGTLNLLEIPDEQLSDWHEFWITIQTNGAAPGTHVVNIYLDGSTSPMIFNVTATSDGNSEYVNDAWLVMGLSSSDLLGSVDVDFYAYSLGVLAPVAAGSASAIVGSIPEPSCLILATTGFGMFVMRKGNRIRHGMQSVDYGSNSSS
jgi:hypothetical protein